MQDSTIKLRRRGPLMLFVMLITWLCLSVIISYDKIGQSVSVHVQKGYNFPFETIQNFNVEGSKFETGREGVASFTPSTFKEAFILETIVNRDFFISLIDLIYLLILNGVFFWMVSGVSAGNVFRLKEFNWISMYAFIMLTWVVEICLKWFIIDYFTAKISGGYYQALDAHWNITVLIILGSVIPYIQPFFTKAKELETDQNLTI